VALALAAAMVKMACGYSIGKKKYAEVESELIAVVERCEAISKRALGLADADAVAYGEFARAMKLPRKSLEEKAVRRAALAEAARSATAIPLELTEICVELIDLADETCRIGNPNLVGDAAGGGSLARGALRICQLNVASNSSMIDDDEFVERTGTRMDAAARVLDRSDATVDRYL
jgi:formiminotetrahydrofolate cyclodeaminase